MMEGNISFLHSNNYPELRGCFVVTKEGICHHVLMFSVSISAMSSHIVFLFVYFPPQFHIFIPRLTDSLFFHFSKVS